MTRRNPGSARSRERVEKARPGLREEVSGAPSATAVAAEALRTGVVPLAGLEPRDVSEPDDLPPRGREARMSDSPQSGEESAVGHMSSPDNNEVDAIGRAMGVQEEDSGGLRTSSELLEARDRHRAQNDVPDPKPRE